MVNFRAQRPDRPHPFFYHAQPKKFWSNLILVNLYQHAENETVSSICPGEIVDLQILQSD